jgi:hypothetical protein
MSSSGILESNISVAHIATTGYVLERTVYPYQMILDLKKRYPFKASMLSWFLDYYKNIVSEDQRNPLFFKTKTYQSFPQNPFHKFKNIKKVNDHWLIGNNNNWNILESKDEREREHIQRIIRMKLNQITDRNFSTIKQELLEEIQKMEMFELYDILITEIYDKFLYEKKFQRDYIHLCFEINQLEDLAQKLVTVSIDENNQFYWFPNTANSHFTMNPSEQFYGPFDSEEKVHESINKNIQFRIQLMKFLEVKFTKRFETLQLIRELSVNPDINEEERQEKIYRHRRELFGIMEIIGIMYHEKMVSSKLIHVILLKLFHYDEIQQTGRISHIHDEEIECLIILWKYYAVELKEKANTNEKERVYYDDYIRLFEIIRDQNTNSRLNFLLMDIFDSNNSAAASAMGVQNKNQDHDNDNDDWEKELVEEEELVTDSMNELIESRNIEQFIARFARVHNAFVKNVKELILYTIEHYDESVLKSMWRIVLREKHLSRDNVLTVSNKLMEKADDWELDISGFTENCREFIQFIQN